MKASTTPQTDDCDDCNDNKEEATAAANKSRNCSRQGFLAFGVIWYVLARSFLRAVLWTKNIIWALVGFLLFPNSILEAALLLVALVHKEVAILGELAQSPTVFRGGHSHVMVIVHVVLQREPVVRLSWPVAVFTLPAGSWGETSNGSQLIFTPLAKIFFAPPKIIFSLAKIIFFSHFP